MKPVIGMYAHHQGAGHLQRCRAIASALDAEVTILSSLTDADVVLPLDVDDPSPAQDAEAGGTLHWVPLHVAGLRSRMAMIAGWIEKHQPDVFFVDVSVEVALLVRLMGVPVVTIAMPGNRDDFPHQLQYRQAAALIAVQPPGLETPPHLKEFAHKLHAVGGISRFENQRSSEPAVFEGAERTAAVMQGQGGTEWTSEYWEEVQRACSDWNFIFLGGDYRVENPLPYLQGANVVISAAGQNSVADIALANVNAIFLPQPRPFDEQYATSKLLEELGIAQVFVDLPAPDCWPKILENATATEPRWERWQMNGAAQRAAAVLEEVARSVAPAQENS
ncbi:glycosyltransferase [Rothia amarae]|uniref:glycosyltransferase n=1 Tax=Rothia amarae TaxID=169480 RepID=UPI0019309B7C|nr:glycosyltransferase [Rothia amarae]